MGFMDKMKKASVDLGTSVQMKMDNGIEKSKLGHQNKQIAKQEQAELKSIFIETKNMGDVSIDSNNRLFKVKHASASIKKKSGLMTKTAKATGALMTAGASLAIEHAMKPSDRVFTFDDLRSFELLEDDAQVVGGGVGMALVGGAFFGIGGAIAGAMTGNKKTKKTVDNLILKINLNDLDFPCVMITYINKSTKVSSNDYRKALGVAQETISCLELIAETVSSNSDNTRQAELQYAAQATGDSADAVIKLKQLLDMGVISQAEFDAKKQQFLGL